jgi:hypothetical protein
MSGRNPSNFSCLGFSLLILCFSTGCLGISSPLLLAQLMDIQRIITVVWLALHRYRQVPG